MNSYKIYTKNIRFSFFRKKDESHLDGEITFLDNRILVNDNVFSIDAVKSISFSCFDDYKGKVINPAENKVSEGINNVVEILSKEGKKHVYYFQLDHRYQIRDMREQLIQYHLADKLDFNLLVNMLGLESYNAIQNFKNELPNGGNIRSY